MEQDNLKKKKKFADDVEELFLKCVSHEFLEELRIAKIEEKEHIAEWIEERQNRNARADEFFKDINNVLECVVNQKYDKASKHIMLKGYGGLPGRDKRRLMALIDKHKNRADAEVERRLLLKHKEEIEKLNNVCYEDRDKKELDFFIKELEIAHKFIKSNHRVYQYIQFRDKELMK